jgi:hypothetical protein
MYKAYKDMQENVILVMRTLTESFGQASGK